MQNGTHTMTAPAMKDEQNQKGGAEEKNHEMRGKRLSILAISSGMV